ncbi:hypothetical protein ENBRE01_2308, partial [Enteropsectra breve]
EELLKETNRFQFDVLLWSNYFVTLDKNLINKIIDVNIFGHYNRKPFVEMRESATQCIITGQFMYAYKVFLFLRQNEELSESVNGFFKEFIECGKDFYFLDGLTYEEMLNLIFKVENGTSEFDLAYCDSDDYPVSIYVRRITAKSFS